MTLARLSKYLLATLFILAGLNHFWHTAFYVRIMPPYFPWPVFLVQLSGLCETGLGLLLLPPASTRFAAWGLIALLVAVFPANLNMALHPDRFPEFSPLLLWTRIPLQALLVWWVHRYTTRRPGNPPSAIWRASRARCGPAHPSCLQRGHRGT